MNSISARKLGSITFQEGSKQKKIKEHSFESTAIKSINFPSNVEEIGERAFNGCENLRVVTYQNKFKQTKRMKFAHNFDATAII